MKAITHIEAGVCGFHTTVRAHSEDDQNVTFELDTDCEKIAHLGVLLKAQGPIDAYEEINPGSGSRLLGTAREALPGCCAGCAVPVGLFKSMQVAAGVALPKDIHLTMSQA
jgi:hypothetical protein